MPLEKRRALRRKAAASAAAPSDHKRAGSDAESTVSTRSSNSSASSRWKQEQRRAATQTTPATHLQSEREGDRSGASASQRRPQRQDGSHKKQNEELQLTTHSLGAMVESNEAQMAVLVLIALDICFTAVEMHLHDRQELAVALQRAASAGGSDEELIVTPSLLASVATRLVESFTGFTLFLFLIELAVLAVAFRRQFLAHAGYVLDATVVGVSLTVELYAHTKVVRLLGVLRFWRALRLVRRLVGEERSAHDDTRLLLEREQLRLVHVRMQKEAAEESLKREYESHEGLEQLLRGYKDEIVTLKEALEIAAQAVAEAEAGMETSGQVVAVDTELYDSFGALEAEAVFTEANSNLYEEQGAIDDTQDRGVWSTGASEEEGVEFQDAVGD